VTLRAGREIRRVQALDAHGRELEPGFVVTNEPGCYFIPALISQWRSEKKFEQFINYSKVEKIKGMSITFVTSAQTDEMGRALLRHLGMPFKQ